MTVIIKRHPRRKRPAFYVTHDGVELRVPARMANRTIEQILSTHTAWVETQLTRLPKKTKMRSGHLRFQGEWVPLERTDGATFTYETHRFTAPRNWDESEVQTAYVTFLKEEALRQVKDRSAAYEERLGRAPKRIRIGHQKTRWGSCSSNGTISINVRLMLAPPWILDYVIAHEWVHLVHFDHSSAFWDKLRLLYPRTSEAMEWLKQNGHTLHIKKPSD